MRVIGRLLLALAVLFPVSVGLAAAANGATGARGPAVMKCMHWKDSMRISPGVSANPANQTVVAHGRVYGCNKVGGGAVYSATMHMNQASCGNLSMSGTASFDWTNGTHSTAFLTFHQQALEPNKILVGGSITSGQFQGLIAIAWLRFTQIYEGSGANCTASNLLQHIDFTNSQSLQLQAPAVTTTTQPFGPTTTPNTNPGTSPNTVPQTVPVTNQGSTVPYTFPPPITVIFQGGGGGGPPIRPAGGVVTQGFPTGTLAFTGSNGIAAVFGFEALLVGGALACSDPARRRRRFARFAEMRRDKSFLKVTLPPMR